MEILLGDAEENEGEALLMEDNKAEVLLMDDDAMILPEEVFCPEKHFWRHWLNSGVNAVIPLQMTLIQSWKVDEGETSGRDDPDVIVGGGWRSGIGKKDGKVEGRSSNV